MTADRLALPSYGRPRGAHPPLDYSGYRSTALRHPKKPLVLLPQRLTEITGPLLGPYSIAELGTDVLVLFNSRDIERVAYRGVSLGGLVGMWLAANAPERITRLGLCCTSAYLPPPSMWAQRAATARSEGATALMARSWRAGPGPG